MKILLANALFPSLGIGGSERSTYFLAKGLMDLGHEVLVFTQNVKDSTIEERVDQVPVIRVACRPGTEPNIFSEPYYQRLAAAASHGAHPLHKQFAEVLHAFRPDVVHTAVIGRLSGLWKEAKAANAAVVHTLRGYASLCGRRMVLDGEPCSRQCRDCAKTRVAAREESSVVDGVVGVSRHVLDVHLRSGWFKQSRLKEVIGNSYSASDEPSDEDARRPRYDFGFIGRLHSTKGVELFLDALEGLRNETGRGFTALIAGTGNAGYEHALKSRYESDLTSFVGYVPPAGFFRDVRFCVVPSTWYEPFGRVFVESLSHEVPVVGSKRGGGADVLEDGRTGWVFEPTLADMTGSLRKAAELGEADYQAMRAAAGARAQDFSVRRIAGEYERIYERLRAQA